MGSAFVGAFFLGAASFAGAASFERAGAASFTGSGFACSFAAALSMRAEISSTTSSTVISDESIVTAPGAGSSLNEAREESALSRRAMSFRMASSDCGSTATASPFAVSPPARSTARRCALASGFATRNTLTSASGKTTEAISLPSATTSPWAPNACWRPTISALISGMPATTETSRSTSAVRIASLTSSPSRKTCVFSAKGPNSIFASFAQAASAWESLKSMPLRSARRAQARYIAPVSR